MNPYTPYDLIAASERALESWKQLSLEEQVAFFKKIGLLDENGDIHPDYDWTAERYAREFGPRTTAPASAVEIKPASSGG